MNCLVCNQTSFDSIDFESGNNAEIPVTVNLCEEHFKEAEEYGHNFERKYAEEIIKAAYEKLNSMCESFCE